MIKNKLKNADAYQVKHRGIKYAFVILHTSKKIEITAYKGAIVKRSGYIFKQGKEKFFIGLGESSRSKSISNKMNNDEIILSELTSTALLGGNVDNVIKTLRKAQGRLEPFSKILMKGINKHYE